MNQYFLRFITWQHKLLYESTFSEFFIPEHAESFEDLSSHKKQHLCNSDLQKTEL